jgi:hypothetical protein
MSADCLRLRLWSRRRYYPGYTLSHFGASIGAAASFLLDATCYVTLFKGSARVHTSKPSTCSPTKWIQDLLASPSVANCSIQCDLITLGVSAVSFLRLLRLLFSVSCLEPYSMLFLVRRRVSQTALLAATT